MATVSRAALTCCMAGVLLIPVTLVLLLQGVTTSPAHALPTDDFGDGIRITFDSAASMNLSSVVDDDGNMHVVWEDLRSGNGDVYYVKLDADGNKLTNDAKITNDSALSLHPSVAVDNSGHIFVVWESVEGGSAELYFARLWYYSGNITFEENGLRVSDADPANSTEPEIAVCADGSIALVWTDARNDAGDGNLEIFYKRLSQSGTPVTSDVRITNDVGISERPRMDIDSNGNVHIVWYDFRDSNSGLVINHGVFYRKVTPNGVPMTNETRITFASPSSSPDVAIDSDGNVHVVFDDDRYAAFDIFYTILDGNGTTVVDDRIISAKDDNESRFPRIALSDSRVVDAVWQDLSSGAWAIHYSAMIYDGSLEVYDQPIAGMDQRNATAPVVMCAADNNTFILFVGEVPNEELFFLRTHRADLSIAGGDLSLSTSQPLEGSLVWVNATMRNLAGETVSGLEVWMLVDGVVAHEAAVDSLAAGATGTVQFSHMAEAGDSVITIVLDPEQSIRETDESNNIATVPIVVRVPGVEIESDYMSRSVGPGDNASFNITVENTGSYAAGFVISNSTLPQGWDIYLGISGPLTVPAVNSTTFQIEVIVPDGTEPGQDYLYVNATCVDRPSVSDSLTLMVDVQQVGAISVVSPAGQVVEPTIQQAFTFSVTNVANSNETFEVEATDDYGWITSVSHTEVDLAPEETAEVVVYVTPSRYDPPGTMDTVTLSLASKNITGNAEEGSILLLAGHHREIELSLSQQAFLNYSVPEDRQIVYTIDVLNLGNSAETVKLGLSGLDQFWAFLNTSYVFLDPGEKGIVVLTMTPSLYILAGAYAFNVSASSEAEPSVNDTLSMGVNVLPFYDIETYLDTSVVSPNGSDYLHVNLTIENWGNSIDLVDINTYSESLNGTTVIVDGREYDMVNDTPPPSVLEPGNRKVVTLVLPVPEGVGPGSYLLYVDVSSLTDPSVSSSEVVTLLIPRKGSLFNIYTIIVIAAVAAAAVILVVFLFLRRRAKEEEAKAAERRRQMQRRQGARQGARAAPREKKPGQSSQERRT
ncbi:MAG: hypothetical protein OEM29_05785 [Thermoplasmata archaeon]|nr:hypothetical protein [Thermoplasmata archaeon]